MSFQFFRTIEKKVLDLNEPWNVTLWVIGINQMFGLRLLIN